MLITEFKKSTASTTVSPSVKSAATQAKATGGHEQYVLVNTDAEHYKYWIGVRNGGTYAAVYGRIGKTVTVDEKNLGNETVAKLKLASKVSEKKGKGYELIPGGLKEFYTKFLTSSFDPMFVGDLHDKARKYNIT